MTKIDELHKKWIENPDYQTAYDELEPEFDAETRFRTQALRGKSQNSQRGIELLDKVDRHFGRKTEI